MKTLFEINNKPFFTIGGQAHNASAYSEETMARVWKAAEVLGLNTVAAPVYWYSLEPEEGKFDFSQVDHLIQKAFEKKMKLVLLWFGSWKNGTSHYVPEWVKIDRERFGWAMSYAGAETAILSPCSQEAKEADKKAFLKLMQHLAETPNPVISVQVENEPGMMGTPRDYSPLGEAAFASEVPEEIISWLQTLDTCWIKTVWESQSSPSGGTWHEVFGPVHAAEIFSAYKFATYINEIAAAGKKIFPIPMYVNVWLGEMQNQVPGIDYPSGGAVSRMLDIWKKYTPDIDAICPDVYLQDMESVDAVCDAYHREDNLLYLPETSCSALNTLNMIRQIGRNSLSGVHFFGLDSVVDENGEVIKQAETYARLVQILKSVRPLLETDREMKIYAVTQYEGRSFDHFDFGDYTGYVHFFKQEGSFKGQSESHLDTDHRNPETINVRGKGLIFDMGNHEFYLVGEGFSLVMTKQDTIEHMTTGVNASMALKTRNQPYRVIEEGRFDEEGRFVCRKVRYGDESDYGAWVHYDIGVVHMILN